MTDPHEAIEVATLLDAAVEVARIGGAVLRDRFKGPRSVELKGGIDLVTDADRASEAEIVAYLERRFPLHAILAEEGSNVEGSAEYRWIVDPLDGTTNYAHRVPHFAVSIAVEDAEGLAAAAVYDPLRDELFEAGRGAGARLNGETLRVTKESRLACALLGTGFPYSVWDKPDLPLRLFDAFVRRSRGIRRIGSAALDMCYVAAGRYDGFFEVRLKPWDIAAGTLLVREAGGTVTDLDGGQVDLTAGNVIATNGHLHQVIVEIARAVRSELAATEPAQVT
ncbi:MAG TPA: inositol monophosphatase [Myxococcales bacterium]|jgi:myo-inositol-1(or 4)-monophosphatase|nr:inositol monophosphatase [Myxococcales bacterium]